MKDVIEMHLSQKSEKSYMKRVEENGLREAEN